MPYFEFAEEHAAIFRAVMAALRDTAQNPSGPTSVKDPSGGAAAWDALPLSGKTDLVCMTSHSRPGLRMRCWYTARTWMKDSIHVGMTAALTGRYSLPGRQALLGAQAWVEDTNRAGGIWLQVAEDNCPTLDVLRRRE